MTMDDLLEQSTDFSLRPAADDGAWNQFLESEKDRQWITIAHNPSLAKILAKTFGYVEQNMVLYQDQKMVGVLPAVRIGKKLVSMPHFSYGGPVVGDVGPIEPCLKNVLGNISFEARSFKRLTEHQYEKKVASIIPLKKSPEEQFQLLKPRFRKKIVRSQTLGLRVVHGGAELLDDFYAIYARKMFQKGSPPLGKVFFKNLLEGYEHGEVGITVVFKENRPVAVGFRLCYLGFHELCWASSDPVFDRHNVNSFLFWNIITYSIAQGHNYFSMGRSTINSGSYIYKKQWAPMELPVFYNYSEPVGKSIKEFTFLSKLWKMQPLETSVYLGHVISKYVY
jgi:hypothetical protein